MAEGNEGTTTTPPPAALTDAELRALAYFGVGLGSEGGNSGKNVSYQLSFAGNVHNGVMTPVGNSGYSIGTLQTDLGQHPEVATSLVEAYQTWASTAHPDWVLTDAQQTQTASDLGRNGRTITAQNGRALDATVKSHLDSFLASDAGLTYVHDRDTAQVNLLMRTGSGVNQLRDTALYQGATLDEQAKLATIVLKLENQGGDRYYPRIINGINNGTITSAEDAQTTVNGFLPNRGGRSRTEPDYVETGVAHALEATDVFNALRNADTRNPLHQPWQDVLANPLVNPTQTGQDANWPNLSSEYTAVKDLFLQKTKAPALIEALDQGGAYGYNVPDRQGRPRPQSTSLYASGNDFIVMDGNGAGKAYIGGTWSDTNRADLTRVNNHDGTVDLNINRAGTTERLLHVDPGAPVLRPPQPTTGSVDQMAPMPAQAVPVPTTGERERIDQRQGVVESGPTPLLPTDLRDRSHPGNPAFQRTLGEVYRMEDGQGIPHGPHSEKVAAALLVEAEHNKQGITNVEMRPDGQVQGIARYNAFESEKRVSVNPQIAQSVTMETYAAQWSQARSPHYASNAPAAERTPEQAEALALLSPVDRQMFDKIRGATPAHLSDDVVANAFYAAKQDGIADASKVASVGMVGDRLAVNGTTPGLRGIVDVSQPVPPMQETTQQALAFNQQQAITQQQDEAQRQQRTQETNTRTV
ncbi:hypothetical protein FHY18_002511 [Xanthomonas arboricola]|uniref:XVIPCD domain-containing protein n=1 Tax=Xanthomonas sp. 3793 TaxID=3035312 RepID=UPI002169DBF2|nr:XVIPCD domain-containing protein [Xanthomonas sp. 3793]MCS3746915.1 hypothetical protein [Xanthomonas sp. 3793]